MDPPATTVLPRSLNSATPRAWPWTALEPSTSPTPTSLESGQCLAVDSAGNLYIADEGNARVRMVSPGGAITTFAGGGSDSGGGTGPATSAELGSVTGLAADGQRNVYIVDSGSRLLRKVSAAGVI